MTTQDTQIPENIIRAARELDKKFWNQSEPEETITVLVAKAILAERQRCADAVGLVSREWIEGGNPDLQTALGQALSIIIAIPKGGAA